MAATDKQVRRDYALGAAWTLALVVLALASAELVHRFL